MSHPKNSDFIQDFQDGSLTEEEEALAEAHARSNKENFAQMLGESLKGGGKRLKVGDRITGKILVIGQEDVFVSTGTQNDGMLSKRELLEADGTCPFKVDDVLNLFVVQVRGSEIRLSRNATDRTQSKDLEEAFRENRAVSGRVAEVCKGGFRVNVKGKLAFCPISQLDTKHIEQGEEYVGKTFDFRITQFEEGGRNIVVSRRRLLEEDQQRASGSFLEEHKDGEIVPGKVSRLEKYGAFVELAPGLDGLVHISEIAWSRIGDPSEVLGPGQPVSVKILKREVLNGRAKISLSIKQATDRPTQTQTTRDQALDAARGLRPEDPWSKYAVGQIVTGQVIRKEPYGLFVQLEPGITGLLHQSRATDRQDFPYDKLKVKDTVTVQIGELKLAERRISLDVPKDAEEGEWRKHVVEESNTKSSSFGTLGASLQAAMAKKK